MKHITLSKYISEGGAFYETLITSKIQNPFVVREATIAVTTISAAVNRLTFEIFFTRDAGFAYGAGNVGSSEHAQRGNNTPCTIGTVANVTQVIPLAMIESCFNQDMHIALGLRSTHGHVITVLLTLSIEQLTRYN